MNVRLVALLALVSSISCRRSSTADTAGGVGTVEMVEVDVAPLTPARVVRVLRDEGAAVRAGDTVALLTQTTLQSDIEARRARVAAAQATLRDLSAGARPAEVQRADDEVRAAHADVARTTADLQRYVMLAARGNVSQQQLGTARSAAAQAVARRDAAEQTLRLLKQGPRTDQIAGARAEVQAAQASLEGARSSAAELVLVSPIRGVVTSRNTEPGEVLGAGQSAVTVADVTRPFVRIYVNERVLPLVKVGMHAVATLDAFPDRQFTGRVESIATHAEFTPRVALTEDERADLLFGVKVALTDSGGMLKAGLPVTVRLQVVAP
jgi:HlyD family secretion protein